MASDGCVGPQLPVHGGTDAAGLATNGASRGMAHLWHACREAESERKRLEAELRAEKEARAAERVTLLARLHAAGVGNVDAREIPPVAPPPVAPPPVTEETISKVLEAARLAAIEGANVRRYCAEQRVRAASAEDAARRLEEKLSSLIALCSKCTSDGNGRHGLASPCDEGVASPPLRRSRSFAGSPASAKIIPSSPSSSSSSSRLAPSPLSLLSEAPSIPRLDDCSRSFRAHSLSYSEEAPSISPITAIVGPWSDDAQLLRRLQRHVGSQTSGVPFGRRVPRGGRQPHRLKLQVDGMNRLPEFVSRRLHKVRSQSLGVVGGLGMGAGTKS